MRVVIGCEESGRVRDAFLLRGHDAISCDLRPTSSPGPHFQGDIFDLLEREKFDLGIFHPDCTFLTVSGLHWNKRDPARAQKTEDALVFFQRLLDADIPKIAIENPVGCVSTRIRKPDQIIQPYEFGDDASKKTCLWLRGLPKLEITGPRFPGRVVEWPVGSGKMVERWSNQTDSGQNRLGPSEERACLRSKTYYGIANALAEQWGGWV